MTYRQRTATWVGGFATMLMVALVLVGKALPTPGQFELDGNAVVDGSGDDWANTVPTITTSKALVSTFIADGSGNKTIFTGGGSKDILDMNNWGWKDQLGGLPDKDNITNAYAAAYANASGDLTVYFGADRFATAGDAELGFWFFHQRVSAVNGVFVGPDGVTPAQHTLGDIFVLANFDNGGSVATAQVYKWNGSGLTLVDTAANALCGSNSDPNVCAITNTVATTSPWAYQPKSGITNVFPPVSFFEGGINLSAFISTAAGGCFSSFMAETRSSTSLSATQKDFALGEFNTCKLDIVKECPLVSFDAGTGLLTYTSNITVTNSGFGTVFDVTVTDTPTGQAPTTLTLASLARNTSNVFTHTFTQTPSPSMPNPPSNTASVTAAVAPGGLPIVSAGPVTAACQHVDFDASLTISKTCNSTLEIVNNQIVVAVNIAGQVCNVAPAPGSNVFPESISNIVVTDTPAVLGQPLPIGTLATGACKTYSSKYYPSALTGGSILAHDQVFTDTAMAAGTGAISGNARANTASATCPLCQ